MCHRTCRVERKEDNTCGGMKEDMCEGMEEDMCERGGEGYMWKHARAVRRAHNETG